jgi:outer membrane autotransporter protein
MYLFHPLRLLTAVIFMLLLSPVLFAEESGWMSVHNGSILWPQAGNTFYRGQSLRTDKFDNWQTRFWATPYGNWEHRHAGADSAGFQADAFGVTAGLQRRWNRHLTWGGGAGGSWIRANSDGNSGSKNMDGFKTMLDAALEVTDWRLQVSAGYGHNSQTIRRHDLANRFGGNNNADQWGIRAEFQLKRGAGLFEMEPFAGLDYMTLSEKSYTEHSITGAGLPQSFGKFSENSLASTLGVRYRWRQTGQLVVWRPELSAAWFREFGSNRVFRSSQLDPFPTLYTFPGSRRPRNHLLVSAGIVGHLGSTMDIFVRYATDIATDDTSHTVLCGTYWKF